MRTVYLLNYLKFGSDVSGNYHCLWLLQVGMAPELVAVTSWEVSGSTCRDELYLQGIFGDAIRLTYR
jgi:hypothetical protein